MNSVESMPATPATVLGRPASPLLDWVEVEGEVVAWHQESESLHSWTRSPRWCSSCATGRRPSQTIDDLADAFSKPVSAVAHDIITCAASLEDLGLLARVE